MNRRPPKEHFHTSITISDDQSVREKVEERNLLALRVSNEPAQSSTPNIQAPIPNPQGGALAEYQMQLMLLEQQNKRRLLMARMEQPVANDMPMDTPMVKSLTVDLPTMKRRRYDTESALTNLLSGDVSGMNLEELQGYIKRLQAEALKLGANQEDQTPSRYQILYRILREAPGASRDKLEKALSQPFFDPPECITGQRNARLLRSTIPLENFDLYLEQNKNISFIVYRTYVEPSMKTEANKRTDPGSNATPPKVDESIRPISKDLIFALETVLKSRDEFADILQTFKATSEVHAPYLFLYHLRNDLAAISSHLNPLAREQLKLLLDCIMEYHGSKYATADGLISQGKISPDYIDYLFRPGDVLIQRGQDHYQGWVASSWPRLGYVDRFTRREAKRLEQGTPIPLYGSKEASKKMGHDMVQVQYWAIKAWHWDFDGNFQRRTETLHFTVLVEDDQKGRVANANFHDHSHTKDNASHTESNNINIHELRVFPLRFGAPEVVDKLRRRGKTFWKCRHRQFVSYQENEKDEIQIPVSLGVPVLVGDIEDSAFSGP